ncbi:HIT family protein [Mesobacillus thioparans]|uniref:HIT family protein n=1 Tax=Mesobacillus thioparans TaxID=370439 RepID=UPI0039EE4CB2
MHTCKMCDFQGAVINKVIKRWRMIIPPKPADLSGYVILTPIEHKENWSEITVEEYQEAASLLREIEKALNSKSALERLYTVTISEEVRHLHIHVIPRYKDRNLKGVDLIKYATQAPPAPENEENNTDFSHALITEIFNNMKA